jgi:hypothetical protein
VIDLVTKAECYPHLRIDESDSGGSPHDPWLDIFIPAISGAVASWLKDNWRLYVPEVDSDGEILRDSNDDPVPSDALHPTVKAATLIELASQFRFREGGGDNAVESHQGHGYTLSRGATAILSGLRKSTVR